jgi:NAD(P)-dependent dehydrogenase (short-subunit alcohol dehydrogenase family)
MAIVGLANTLKLEGKKHNITVNTVAPIAGTRLTEDVMPPDLF